MGYECCICGEVIKEGYGNDPWPIRTDGVCCDRCNLFAVIPARVKKREETESNEQTDKSK